MRSALLLWALCTVACSSGETGTNTRPSPSGPEGLLFDDATTASGLSFRHDAGLSPEKQLPETMGAGAALADFNGDGHLDLYLVQSGPLPLSTPLRAGAGSDPSTTGRHGTMRSSQPSTFSRWKSWLSELF